jgi:hypothetical protein
LEEGSEEIVRKKRERVIKGPLFLVYLRLLAITPRTTTISQIHPNIINISVDGTNKSIGPVSRGAHQTILDQTFGGGDEYGIIYYHALCIGISCTK